ncbi:MAG TPA: hypothetical protein VN151_06330 [Terracidiphilus sp.]|nr:hypothetical protein [Terracidiphilus sp.]
MIRQAISCDICGTDKQQTNHWFVAYDHHGELRIADWTSQSRLRAGVKHLCGQTCLHKLVDEFIAKTISVRPSPVEKPAASRKSIKLAARASTASRMAASWGVDTTAVSAVSTRPITPRPVPVPAEPVAAEYTDEFESSARLISTPAETPSEVQPTYNSSSWRSGAWKRERERTQGSVGRSIA